MDMVKRSKILPLILAAIAGMFAFNSINTLPLVVLFPLAWALAAGKKHAFVISMVYYLIVSRSLAQGSYQFADEFSNEYILWLSASLILSGIWALFWRKDNIQIYFIFLNVILILPPIGIINWANPLLIAGSLLPAMGWMGLSIGTIILSIVVKFKSFIVSLLIIIVGTIISLNTETHNNVDGWQAHNTYIVSNFDGNFLDAYKRQTHIQSILQISGKNIVNIFPESMLGFLTNQTYSIWENEESHILIGGYVATERSYNNSLVLINKHGIFNVYNQRIPPPFGMWNPFKDNMANAHWFRFKNTFSFLNKKVAPIICYEGLLLWTLIQSQIENPDIYISIINDDWAKNTNLPTVQGVHLESWARLFNKELLVSINYGEKND